MAVLLSFAVMAGLDPAIHAAPPQKMRPTSLTNDTRLTEQGSPAVSLGSGHALRRTTWVAGSSPAMTPSLLPQVLPPRSPRPQLTLQELRKWSNIQKYMLLLRWMSGME
jgi:hypothetical protein